MLHADGVEGFEVERRQCGRDLLCLEGSDVEPRSSKGEGITTNSTASVHNGGQFGLEKASCVVARDCQPRGNFEALFREQHVFGELAELVVGFCAQGELTHHGAHRRERVAFFAQRGDSREDVVLRMGFVDASKERERFACEESIELTSVHRPILSGRHELALVLREC